MFIYEPNLYDDVFFNSKVVDIIKEMKEYGCDVDIHDPWADSNEVIFDIKSILPNSDGRL